MSWNNATPDSADFSSDASALVFTVTLGENITAGGITLQTLGSRVVTLDGGYTLNLARAGLKSAPAAHRLST